MKHAQESITKITVRGFKSIVEKTAIEIRPLTLLAGANSSGKSSFMQPLLLLKQTLESPSDPGALLMNGPNVQFTKTEQMLSKFSGKESGCDFSVGIELGEEQSVEFTFSQEKSGGFNVSSMSLKREGMPQPQHIVPNMSQDSIIKILSARQKEFQKMFEEGELKGRKYHWGISRDRCFLCLDFYQDSNTFAGGMNCYFWERFNISRLQQLIHLPGLRGNPQRTYPRMAVGDSFPGTFEAYVAGLINHWKSTEKETPLLKQLGKNMEELGLTWKVDVSQVDDTQVELRVGRLPHSKRGGAADMVNIADVGFGVSQSLPVLVALTAAKPGQVVYLEQPEIHLHPRAQRRLASVVKQASERGVVVIIETHSSLLLKEIQTLVAKGQLDRNIVKLHWFQRQENGQTTVSSTDLDENGAFGAAWPVDFDEVELEAEKDYLDAVESRS